MSPSIGVIGLGKMARALVEPLLTSGAIASEQLMAIERQQLIELWGDKYGNSAHGGHAELWFGELLSAPLGASAH